MENVTLPEGNSARKVMFHRVAENLYRLETSGGYYALVKRGNKQFRRSLKTKDRKLAERRLAEFQAQVGNLTISDDARLSFDEIAKRWMDTTKHAIKDSTIMRRETCIKNLSPFFHGTAVRNIQPHHCGRWHFAWIEFVSITPRINKENAALCLSQEPLPAHRRMLPDVSRKKRSISHTR